MTLRARFRGSPPRGMTEQDCPRFFWSGLRGAGFQVVRAFPTELWPQSSSLRSFALPATWRHKLSRDTLVQGKAEAGEGVGLLFNSHGFLRGTEEIRGANGSETLSRDSPFAAVSCGYSLGGPEARWPRLLFSETCGFLFSLWPNYILAFRRLGMTIPWRRAVVQGPPVRLVDAAREPFGRRETRVSPRLASFRGLRDRFRSFRRIAPGSAPLPYATVRGSSDEQWCLPGKDRKYSYKGGVGAVCAH